MSIFNLGSSNDHHCPACGHQIEEIRGNTWQCPHCHTTMGLVKNHGAKKKYENQKKHHHEFFLYTFLCVMLVMILLNSLYNS